MQIKTYRGTSNYEILKKIKHEMGDTAIILNTRTEEINGKKIYTIMAANDMNNNSLETSPQDTSSKKSEERWYREWIYFKEQIFSIIKDTVDLGSLTSRQKAAIRHLEIEGVGEDYIMHLIMLLKRNGRSFMEILNSTIKVCPWDENRFQNNNHIFIGPHGVGKTSIILKLALRYKKKISDAKICLVSVDNYQGKGKLYLKHYAELSNFRYREVRGFTELTALLGEIYDYDVVLFDTPGLKREQDLDQFFTESSLNMLEKKNIHLVLSPTYSRQQIDYYLERYLSDQISSLIFTKLDESCTYGSIIYTAFKTKIPISLFSIGPHLKDSLTPATSSGLWNLVFKHKLPMDMEIN